MVICYIWYMSTKIIISVDTETGGLFPDKHPLLQIGMGIYVIDMSTLAYTAYRECEWNLKPSQFTADGTRTLDPEAMKINHLDQEALERDGFMVSEVSRSIRELLVQARKECGRLSVLGQNYTFDRGFLHEYLPADTFADLDLNQQIDLLTLSGAYNSIVSTDWDNPPSRSLGNMCRRLGVTNDDAHTALSDARATFLCYVALQKKFREVGRIIEIGNDLTLKHNELTVLLTDMT